MGNGTDPRAANGTDDGRSELSQAGQQAILRVYVLTHHLYHRHQYLSRACRQKAIEVVTIVCGVLWFAGPLPGFPVLPCAAAFLAGLATLLVMQFGNKGQDASQRTCHWEVLLREIEAAVPRKCTETQLYHWYQRAVDLQNGERITDQRLLQRCYQRAQAATDCVYPEAPPLSPRAAAESSGSPAGYSGRPGGTR